MRVLSTLIGLNGKKNMKRFRFILLSIGLLFAPSYLMAQDIVVDGIKYSYTSDTTASVVGYEKGITDVVIPEIVDGHTVTSLKSGYFNYDEGCFSDCYTLKSIVIPSTVTSIGKSSFNFCTALKSIIIPGGVTNIEYRTFANCTALEGVNLPEGLVKIEASSFWGCMSLKSITIPTKLETIKIEKILVSSVLICPFVMYNIMIINE